MCRHYNILLENGNSWCSDCGAAMGAIYKPEMYLEDEENWE